MPFWAMKDSKRAEITAEKRETLDRLAEKVIERRLAAPAILFLESSKPLSFLGNQTMVFFQPIVQTIFNFKTYDDIMDLLEDRENIEYLLKKIEELEAAIEKERASFEEKTAGFDREREENAARVNQLEAKVASVEASAEEGQTQLKGYIAEANERTDKFELRIRDLLEEIEITKEKAAKSVLDEAAAAELVQIRLPSAKQAETIRRLTDESKEREPLLESLTSQPNDSRGESSEPHSSASSQRAPTITRIRRFACQESCAKRLATLVVMWSRLVP